MKVRLTMNSFLDFITNDIEAKKTLLSSMPINNKTTIFQVYPLPWKTILHIYAYIDSIHNL